MKIIWRKRYRKLLYDVWKFQSLSTT